MSQKNDTSDTSIELETVDLAQEKADSVDYLNEYLLIAEWTKGRLEQSATLTYDVDRMGEGEGWVVVQSDNGAVQKTVFGEDFEDALERFENCLEQAENNDSVAYA